MESKVFARKESAGHEAAAPQREAVRRSSAAAARAIRIHKECCVSQNLLDRARKPESALPSGRAVAGPPRPMGADRRDD
jgi:hypothetical protein